MSYRRCGRNKRAYKRRRCRYSTPTSSSSSAEEPFILYYFQNESQTIYYCHGDTLLFHDAGRVTWVYPCSVTVLHNALQHYLRYFYKWFDFYKAMYHRNDGMKDVFY